MSSFVLIIIAILGWGFGSFFIKIANDSIDPIMVVSFQTALYVLLVPLAILVFKPQFTLNVTGVAASLVGGSIMSLGTLAYFFALQKGNAGAVTMAVACYPAITLILSMLFLGEGMSVRKGFGIFLALTSVAILSKK